MLSPITHVSWQYSFTSSRTVNSWVFFTKEAETRTWEHLKTQEDHSAHRCLIFSRRREDEGRDESHAQVCGLAITMRCSSENGNNTLTCERIIHKLASVLCELFTSHLSLVLFCTLKQQRGLVLPGLDLQAVSRDKTQTSWILQFTQWPFSWDEEELPLSFSVCCIFHVDFPRSGLNRILQANHLLITFEVQIRLKF